MPDPNKAWSNEEKKDFEKGLSQKPDYWGNLKSGLGISSKDTEANAMERRRKRLEQVKPE